MFYKTYSFVLIFMCCSYFSDVIADILISDKTGNPIFHTKKDSSKQYENLIMTFVNVKKIIAEIYLNYKNSIGSQNNEKIIKLKITFENSKIILNHETRQRIVPYNKGSIKILEKFIQNIDENIEFKVVKINKNNPDSNTPLINDTIYDEKLKAQLEGIQKLSLWNFVKNDPVKLNFIRKSSTTLEDLINNSTKYERTLQSTLNKAIEIMFDRSLKYMILLSVYAYEILIIQRSSKSYWGQLLEVSNKINEVMIKLDHKNNASFYLDLLINAKYDGTDRLAKLKGVAKEYALYFIEFREWNKYNFQYTYTDSDLWDNNILPQDLINELLKGFPKQQENEKPYNFHRITKNLEQLKEKLEKIFSLIQAEYNTIV